LNLELLYYQATLIPFSPSDPTLTNGGLTIKIRQDNGAIASAVFNGIDYFNSGTPVSNWGLEVNGSFVSNSTIGGGASSSVTSLSSDTVQVVSTYNGVRATRIYKIFGETLQVSVKVENLNLSSTTVKIFDTFDPDQIQFGQNLDAFSQTIPGGVIKAAQASQGTAQTVVLASVDPSISISAGNPFQIFNPGDLNFVLSSPGDPNGAFLDLGIHAATSRILDASQSFNYSYVMAFGSTSSSANTNLVNSINLLIPTISAPPSFTVVEDVAGSLTFTGTPFTDLDSADLVITLSIADGAITGTAIAGITIGGTATARTFSGTKAALNSYFTSAGNITYTSALNNNSPRSLSVNVSDGSLAASATSTINITPVNDAPILNASATPVLTAIAEDSLNSPGNTVAEIVVDGSITDVDIVGVVPEAIAISAVDNTNGTWQYQLSGGSWTAFDFTGPNTGKALLLDSTAQIRFVPNANYNGTASFTFRAWDKTVGSSGSYFTLPAAAGTLDSSFGTGGIAFADFSNGLDIVNTIAVQADGKTIVAGYTHPSSGYRDSAFARFNNNGTLDTTFGSGGKVIIDLGSTGNDQIEKIHALSGGGLLATGIAYQGSGLFNFSLTKLTASGSLDTSFGNGGKVVTNLGNNSYIYDSVILANGKIVAVGGLQNAGFAVVQYNSDGTLDTSFDADGIATTTLGSIFDTARSVTTTPDGKILVAGFYYGPSGQTLGLARFNSNGSLDTTFDGDGKLTVGDRIFVDDEQSTIRVVSLADGKFLVGATVAYPNGFYPTVYRFNQDGTLDSTFAQAGKQKIDINSIDYLFNDLKVTGDGKIVLGLTANQGTPSNPDFDFAAVRLNPDGSLDTGFGTNGITTIPVSTLGSGANDFARGIQIDAAGNILIGGYSYQTAVFNGDRQFALVRLKGDALSSPFSAQGDTASITVTPVNDPPILDLNGAALGTDFSATFTEDGGTVSIVSPTLSLTDIDSTTISSATITITNLQESATESLSLPSTFGYMAAIYSTSTGTFQLLGTATLAQYQQVLRTITYNNTSQNPNPTPRLISFVVNDGTSNSSIAISTVSINPVNDAPIVANAISTQNGTEDTAVNFTIPANTFSDVDNASLTLTATLGDGSALPTWLIFAPATGTFSGTPPQDFNDTISLKVTATDSGSLSASSTFDLVIAAVNDVPVAVASSNAVLEDATITGSVSATDADAGAVLTYALVNAAPTGLTFNNDGTYTFDASSYDSLAAGQTQVLDIAFTATDGIDTSTAENLTITITGTNDVPVAVASSNAVLEDATITGSVSATDADTGAVLTYALVNAAPTGLTFNNDGTYSFDASSYDSLAAGQTQVLSIAFTATDGIATSTAENLTITITGTNDTPVATSAVNAVNEDAVITGSVSATDADAGAVLTYALVNAAPTGLTFNSNGTYTFDASSYDSLATGQTQVLNIAFTATDGTATSTAENLTITITGTNDVPVAVASSNTVLEDATITGSVSATDIDAGTVLTYNLVNAAPTGLTFNSNGTYTFDASSYDSLATGQTQVLNIAFTAADGIATSTAKNLTITITGTNDVAIITGTITGSVLESGTSTSGTPTATGDLNATDVDNTSDTWTAVTTATTSTNGYGTYTLTASGLWAYTLNNTNSAVQALNTGNTLTDTFTVQTIDGTTQTVSITINGTNDAPIISSFSDDTGASGSDRITKDNTLTLAGIAEANSTIQLFNGLTSLGTTTTNGLGAWNLTTATLTDGTYNLTAKATDPAGNTSASSAPLSVTVDTTALAPTLSLATDSGSSSTDKITNSGVVNVSGLEPGASWEYSSDGGFNWIIGTGTNFTLTEDGTKYALARQTDLAGNTSSISTFIFTLDTTAPIKTSTVTTMTLDTGASSTDFLTNNGSAGRIYNGTLSAALSAGETLQVSVDGGTTWANATVSTTNWNFTDNTAKSSNWNILTRVVDTAGNGTIRSKAVTLDQQISAASAVTLDLAAASDTGSSATDNLTTVVRPTFAVTFESAKAQVGDILEIRQGATLLGSFTLTATQVSAGTANITLATNLTNGINTLTALHRDAAGNSVTGSSPLAVTLDQQISAASTVTLDLLASSDSGSSATDNVTNLALSTFAIAFDATKSQAGDIIEIRKGTSVLGSITLNATQVSTGIVNVTLTTALTSGANTLSAVHRDAAGNSVIGSSTLAVTLDTTAPVAANIIGYTATSIVGTTEPNASVLLSNSAVAPTTFAATATAAANGNYTLNTSTLAGSNAGTTYYLYAQDVAGNLSPLNSSQKVIVGTAGADTLINVGSTAGDLLVGGLGTDTAQYAVASNAIALTGQVTAANITSGSINIRTANIDVLTGLETLQFTGSGYSGVGTGTNQLRSSVQTALSNNSIAAFTGAYDAATGIFTLGSSPSNNATLVAFDSNISGSTNYETFLLLDKTSIVGGLSVGGGTVTLGL
jgi:uncharacterized delta-60 repeat protein